VITNIHFAEIGKWGKVKNLYFFVFSDLCALGQTKFYRITRQIGDVGKFVLKRRNLFNFHVFPR